MPEFVLAVDRIQASIESLWESDIHAHFPAYLCLKNEAAASGTTDGLDYDYWDFFDTFLRVEGGPPGKPYLRPFSTRYSEEERMWLNENLAGSYAPSSIRRTIYEFAEEDGENWALKDGHANIAKDVLEGPVQALALAVFLYRDFSFEMTEPDLAPIIKTFAQDFGYLDENGNLADEFGQLYVLPEELPDGEAWLEVEDVGL